MVQIRKFLFFGLILADREKLSICIRVVSVKEGPCVFGKYWALSYESPEEAVLKKDTTAEMVFHFLTNPISKGWIEKYKEGPFCTIRPRYWPTLLRPRIHPSYFISAGQPPRMSSPSSVVVGFRVLGVVILLVRLLTR